MDWLMRLIGEMSRQDCGVCFLAIGMLIGLLLWGTWELLGWLNRVIGDWEPKDRG